MSEQPPGSDSAPTSLRGVFNDWGANLVEYALLIALVVIACIGALTFFADESTDMFTSVCEEIGGTTSDNPECE